MEDGEVREDGVAGKWHSLQIWHDSSVTLNNTLLINKVFNKVFVLVSAVAQQILWNCLIEDPALVLRHFLEKLTVSNRQVMELLVEFRSSVLLTCLMTCLLCQDELIYMLRKLLLNIGDLPAQTSHILFNYLVRPLCLLCFVL